MKKQFKLSLIGEPGGELLINQWDIENVEQEGEGHSRSLTVTVKVSGVFSAGGLRFAQDGGGEEQDARGLRLLFRGSVYAEYPNKSETQTWWRLGEDFLVSSIDADPTYHVPGTLEQLLLEYIFANEPRLHVSAGAAQLLYSFVSLDPLKLLSLAGASSPSSAEPEASGP